MQMVALPEVESCTTGCQSASARDVGSGHTNPITNRDIEYNASCLVRLVGLHNRRADSERSDPPATMYGPSKLPIQGDPISSHRAGVAVERTSCHLESAMVLKLKEAVHGVERADERMYEDAVIGGRKWPRR